MLPSRGARSSCPMPWLRALLLPRMRGGVRWQALLHGLSETKVCASKSAETVWQRMATGRWVSDRLACALLDCAVCVDLTHGGPRQMKQNGKPALEILEEAVHLLRSMPAAALCLYFIGALPFVLGCLYFWADMSQGVFARDHAGLESLLIVLLFVWMNCWQTAFSGELRAQLSGIPSSPWTLQRIGRTVLVQGGIQPTCFLVLPLAALVTLPLAAVFAFYQSVNCDSEPANFAEAVSTARKHATRWPRQNWIILSVIFLTVSVCFVNFILLILQGAYFLKSIFGIETMVTRSMWSAVNSTFFGAVSAFTYLTVDPLVKAVYTLRYFYGDAQSSGEDLRARLHGIPSAKLTAAALIAFALLSPADAKTVSTSELDRAMDAVIQQRQFSWRLPRQSEPTGQNSSILRFAERMANTITQMADAIKHGIQALLQWYEKTFGSNQVSHELPAPGGLAAGMRFLTLFLTASLILVAGLVIYRAFSQRVRPAAILASSAAAVFDISDESASADQLSEEDWLRLSGEFLSAGDLRFGVRALYLGALANLARREFISLTRSKTNRDYFRELQRRARVAPHILPAFVQSVGIYERTWYGRHPVDGITVQELVQTLERMRSDG